MFSDNKNRHDFSDFKDCQREKRSDRPRGMNGVGDDVRPAWMDRYNGYTVQHFPMHLYPPRGAETFDVRESFTLSSPTVAVNLITFVIPANSFAFWRAYSMFSNTPSGVTSEFIFKVNGVPALKYHGSSINYFRKTLALGNDIQGEIDALVELRGNDVITVDATITSSIVPATIAARIKGWIVPAGNMKLERIGS